ncbi:MAG: polymer-forming cytoskeletal protein [Spirochaetales bacterium]|nr:polymer-forming cytoskeletal protein [Spirochaetales bacterium]
MAKNNDIRFAKEKIQTTLGKETNFNGVMKFRDSLKIDGKFQGEIISEGFLYIENDAEIKANITVGSIIVGGVVYGNIEAKESLEMLATGQVFGNIRTAKLKIADGVVFEGKCEMIKSPDTIDIFSDSPIKLKKTIQSV